MSVGHGIGWIAEAEMLARLAIDGRSAGVITAAKHRGDSTPWGAREPSMASPTAKPPQLEGTQSIARRSAATANDAESKAAAPSPNRPIRSDGRTPLACAKLRPSTNSVSRLA